jgi:TolB-like protein/Tfp pilus assembly protein PilF
MVLSVRLFGTFMICDAAGNELSLQTRKSRALLAFLALQPGKVISRERLMTLLWSDRGIKQARQSLNNALMSIRRLGTKHGTKILESDRESVSLVNGVIDTDVSAFQELRAKRPVCAAALYVGPFLDGLSIPDDAFEEWLVAARSEFQNKACETLRKAADEALEANDRRAAIAALRRTLELDPLLEDVHRQLMQLLNQTGDRTAALRQYEICADILQRELQIKPDSATKRVLAQIKVAGGPLEAGSIYTETGLANRPSIAVLPFDNISGNPEHDYFADGMTEDITAELSRFRNLFVIDRRSSFAYRGLSVKVQDVAGDLGISYGLVGSLRISGKRLRIATQLIEAATGKQIWAERYNREIEDVFSVQDEITEAIVSTFETQIGAIERQKARRKPPGQLDAWECYQRGLWHLYRTTKTDNAEAKLLMDRSIDLDGEFSLAHTGLSHIYHQQAALGWAEDTAEAYRRAGIAARRAVEIDPCDAQAHVALGRAYMLQGESEACLAEFREALDLNSNSAFASYRFGTAFVFAGRAREALPLLRAAVRQSPRDPERYRFDRMIGIAYFMLAEHEDALPWLQASSRQSGNDFWTHLGLAANYAALGDPTSSKASLKKTLEIKSDLTMRFVANFLRGQCGQYNDYYLQQLRKAGVPE